MFKRFGAQPLGCTEPGDKGIHSPLTPEDARVRRGSAPECIRGVQGATPQLKLCCQPIVFARCVLDIPRAMDHKPFCSRQMLSSVFVICAVCISQPPTKQTTNKTKHAYVKSEVLSASSTCVLLSRMKGSLVDAVYINIRRFNIRYPHIGAPPYMGSLLYTTRVQALWLPLEESSLPLSPPSLSYLLEACQGCCKIAHDSMP